MTTMPHHYSSWVFLALSAACLSGDAWAQTSGNGSLRGQVKDEQGAVLSGAVVVAESVTVPIPAKTTTDDRGFYRLLDLPPGEYKITAEYPGFTPTIVKPVVMRFGLNLNVDVRLAVGAQLDAVTVTVTAPMIEARSAVNAFNLSGDLQRALPLSSRKNWSDFLVVTPGVTALQNSSQSAGIVDAYSLRGSRFDSHVIQIDGADMAAVAQNSPNYIRISTEAIADVQVNTGAPDASSPLGEGAVINVATKSGTNLLSGALSLALQRRAWTSNNSPGGTSQAVDSVQPEAALGGPLIRNRLWLFGAYQYYRTDAAIARSVAQLATLRALDQSFEPFDAISRGHFMFTKSTAQLSQMHRLEVSHRYDPVTSPSTSPTALAVGQVIRNGSGRNVAFRLSSIWGDHVVTSLGASSNNSTTSLESIVDAPSMPVASRVRLIGGRMVPDNNIANLSGSGTSFVNTARKSTLHADLTYVLSRWLGTHEVRTGFDYQPKNQLKVTFLTPSEGLTQVGYVLLDSSDPSRGVQPYRKTVYDDVRYTFLQGETSDIALYFQDAWRIKDHVTLDVGVRLDRIKRDDALFGITTQRSTNIGPRIGVNYALTDDRRNILRASWVRIHDAVSVGAVSVGSVSPGQRSLYDTDFDGIFETVFVTPPITAQAASLLIDRGRSQPFVDEWALGYRRASRDGLTMDIGLVRRAYKNSLAAVEINRLYDGGQFRGYRDEAFNDLYENTNNKWNWPAYYGLEAQVIKDTKRLRAIGAYTRSWRHLGGTWMPNEPDSFIQPETFPNNKSLGDNYAWQDHVVRVGAIYSAPWRLLAAVSYVFQSGAYSGPMLTNRTAPDPQFGPPVVTLPNGRVVSNPLATIERYAYNTRGDGQLKLLPLHVLNVRVGRSVSLGRTARLELSADAFNLTNHDSDQGFVYGATLLQSATYGMTESRQQPRTLRLSTRFAF